MDGVVEHGTTVVLITPEMTVSIAVQEIGEVVLNRVGHGTTIVCVTPDTTVTIDVHEPDAFVSDGTADGATADEVAEQGTTIVWVVPETTVTIVVQEPAEAVPEDTPDCTLDDMDENGATEDPGSAEFTAEEASVKDDTTEEGAASDLAAA